MSFDNEYNRLHNFLNLYLHITSNIIYDTDTTSVSTFTPIECSNLDYTLT